MQIIREIDALRTTIKSHRVAGKTIALVPTMGALHAGHLQLMKEATRHADIIVASIFVNPTQFGENEDLDAYPRQEASDAALLEAEGVAILWAPTVDQVYPEGFSSNVRVNGLSSGLCDNHRPGHFDGVTTVVAKLFNQVLPDVALFGEKDFQQLAIIRRMAKDLDFQINVMGVATVRDPDGLAMSSRNAYLSKDERVAAVTLPDSMKQAAREIAAGGNVTDIIEAAKAKILAAGFLSVDYFELRNADDLTVLSEHARHARLFAAARIGGARLIDNIAVE